MQGFNHSKTDKPLDLAIQESGRLSLLAKIGEFEFMEQTIVEGKTFMLVPSDTADIYEFFYILDGEIHSEDKSIQLAKGDFFYIKELQHTVQFKIIKEARFLYINNGSLYEQLSSNIHFLTDSVKKVEDKDEYTKCHSERVMNLAVELGKLMDLGKTGIFRLTYAALFHDLGKIDIPDEILLKKGRLTDEEFEYIKKHPELGRKQTQIFQSADIGTIILEHHENYDGSGYPSGLKGDEICLEARIIAVVDSYDAMTSDRAYRKGMTHEDAIEELRRCSGGRYDPEIVQVFIENVSNFGCLA